MNPLKIDPSALLWRNDERPSGLDRVEFHTAVGIASRRDLMWDRSGKDGWGHFGDAIFINFSHVFLAKKRCVHLLLDQNAGQSHAKYIIFSWDCSGWTSMNGTKHGVFPDFDSPAERVAGLFLQYYCNLTEMLGNHPLLWPSYSG